MVKNVCFLSFCNYPEEVTLQNGQEGSAFSGSTFQTVVPVLNLKSNIQGGKIFRDSQISIDSEKEDVVGYTWSLIIFLAFFSRGGL